MTEGAVRLCVCVFFLTGVVCILLEPSQTAKFRRYTSNAINCTVGENWANVILNINQKGKVTTVGFFSNMNGACSNFKNDTKLYQTGCYYRLRIFYLIITNVTDAFDENLVICDAIYDSSSENANTTIEVQYSPTESPVIVQTPEKNVKAGDKVVLSCKIPVSNPLPRIQWICEGFTSVKRTDMPSTNFVVANVEKTVTEEDNKKECTCVGSHSFWKDDKNAKHSLIVYYRPSVKVSLDYDNYNIVENSTTFNLTCIITDANPAATSYTWYKASEIKSTVATYSIPTVHRTDEGRYACKAANTAGTSELSSPLHLNVLYGIELNAMNKNQQKEGTVLNITCSGQSNPKMTDNDVTWTKQNNGSFIMKGQNLVINNLKREDSGTYVCSVIVALSPTLGPSINVSGTNTVAVDVLYVPTVAISPESGLYELVENTTEFRMTCNATDANPNVKSFTWYKNGLKISTFQTHIISPVCRSDLGKYTCDAINMAGSSDPSSVVQIRVLYGIEIDIIRQHQVNEGTDLNITCSGQSYPAMTDNDVSWTKHNGDGFIEKGRDLVIKNINRKSNGTYICLVVIELKPTLGESVNVTGTTTVEVDVLYLPSVLVYPDFNPSFVTENTTVLRMVCTVTDANPAVSIYNWKRDGSEISYTDTYVISNVKRSHSGNYTCMATNTVGASDPSPVFQLNVLYGVSLKLSETEISVNESERLYLSCIGDGNPMPNITCVNKYNNSEIGEQHLNVTTILVNHANCMDTGIYTCSGNNSIGAPVSSSADIRVACKPRTYNNLVKQDILINGTDESLIISTTFISFPLSNMSWFRQLSNGNSTELTDEFNTSVIRTQLPYEQISILRKAQMETNEFGIYLVKASNRHGSFTLAYDVISKREPYPPTNITASCKLTSIKVSWISRFNGGENQTFRIHFVNNKSNKTTYKDGIADKGEDTAINEENYNLTPDTLYRIILEAYNVYGGTTSTENVNCTTDKKLAEKQSVSSALVGGIAGTISALFIAVIVIGAIYFWRRRQVNGGHKKLIKRHSKDTDEDEEGLKTNPLYVTSGEVSNAEGGPVYGVVNKKRQKKENMQIDGDNDQGPVYSQVQKPTTQEKKKGKEKTIKKTSRNETYKDIELGTVYENSDKIPKLNTSDELYANAEEPGKGANLAKQYIPKKNKDGLIYADLDLMPGPNGRKFVIRGIENKTNYAMIDLSIKVDPLPSDDDDEEDKDSDKAKSAASICNE